MNAVAALGVSGKLLWFACPLALGHGAPSYTNDRAGAALDPERVRAYVAMLRRAVDLTGADRCLLVSHSPEVQEMCDARVEVALA